MQYNQDNYSEHSVEANQKIEKVVKKIMKGQRGDLSSNQEL